jgi:hypothetical protein
MDNLDRLDPFLICGQPRQTRKSSTSLDKLERVALA